MNVFGESDYLSRVRTFKKICLDENGCVNIMITLSDDFNESALQPVVALKRECHSVMLFIFFFTFVSFFFVCVQVTKYDPRHKQHKTKQKQTPLLHRR